MRTRTARIATALGLAGIVLLGACSADDTPTVGAGGTTDGGDGDVGSVGGSTDAAGAPGDSEDGGVLPVVGQAVTPPGTAIIQDVTLRLEVDDPAAAVDAITATARRLGGFVAEADLHRVESGDRRDQLQGTLTLRIPADRLDDAVTTVGELSRVPPETTISTRDVSSQLVDLEARLTNLRTLETELRSFLTEARASAGSTPDTVLTVFNRVSEVRGQIEQLEAQQANLQDLVTLATLRVDLRPAVGAAAVVPEGWSPAGVLRSAARATVTAFQVVANGAIWLAVFVIPLAALAALPLLGVWWYRRRSPTTPTTPTHT